MNDRLKQVWRKAFIKTEQSLWEYGLLGRHNADSTVTFAVPGRAAYIFVTMRTATGSQTVVSARNDAGVAHAADLPVRMKLEDGVYVIYGKSSREDRATVPASPPSGVPIHTHIHDDLTELTDDDHTQYHTDARGDARYFTEAEHLNVSVGAADAGKPIKLDAAGHVDATMINDDDVSKAFVQLTDVPASYAGQGGKAVAVKAAADGLEFVAGVGYTDEQAQDAVGAMLVDTATIDLAYVDATPSLMASVIDDSITNAKLANMATNTVKARVTAATGDAEDVAEATFVGGTINRTTEKTVPVGADNFAVINSVGSVLAWISWTNILAALSGLYVLLAGKAGGQTIYGGTAAGEDIVFRSTSHATKGNVIAADDSNNFIVGSATFTEPFTGFSAQLNKAIILRQATSTAGAAVPMAVILGSSNQTDTTDGNVAQYMFMNEAIASAEKRVAQIIIRTDTAIDYGKIMLRVFRAGVANDAFAILSSGYVQIGPTAPRGQLDVDQSSTTAAVPALVLDQADISEELIEFVSTAGTGNAIDTAALGAYQGKIRITVNGSYFYLPYYL